MVSGKTFTKNAQLTHATLILSPCAMVNDNALRETHTSRRRNAAASSTWAWCESSPLELDAGAFRGCRFSKYSTFRLSSPSKNDDLPYWWTTVSHFLVGPTKRPSFNEKHSPHYGLRRHVWTLVSVGLFLFAVMVYRVRTSSSSLEEYYQAPVWEWYHYHYVPKPVSDGLSEPPPSQPRSLLVAQMSGPGPLSDIADIASRPNRAYSKQWSVDFLRYIGGEGLARECFNKMFVLDALLARQEGDDEDGNQHLHVKRKYDAVLFLPADSIITDLDFDLLSLLPTDKLVAIAGSSQEDATFEDFRTSESGIIMWNLNHEHARTVSKLWLEFIRHPQFTCRDAIDMEFLLMAMESLDDYSGLSDLVQRLEENANGFVAPRVIKFLQSASSSSEPRMNVLVRNIFKTTATLETVSDSVCYRYYPRCEVL